MNIPILLAFVLAAAAQDPKPKKQDPMHMDKEKGFSISLPADKKKMAHWEFILPNPAEREEFLVRIHGDYAKTLEILVYGEAFDGAFYEHQMHADQMAEGLKRNRDLKKATRRSSETVKNFTVDKVNASHLIMDVEGMDGSKQEWHIYCFRSPRNNWVYTLLVMTEAGYLDKTDKDRVPEQVNQILGSFRASKIGK
jgi:hypothetical protein